MLDPCSCCPNRNQRDYIVPGDGPAEARIAAIGESPGLGEHYGRRPFIGKTGREFNQRLLPSCGLSRTDVYVDNAMKCMMPGGATPPLSMARTCAEHHLRRTLERMENLDTIVAMGATACAVLAPEVSLDSHHGFPRQIGLWGRVYDLMPMIHPAAGLHQPRLMREIEDDFQSLKEMLRGDWREVADEHPATDYQEVAWFAPYAFALYDRLAIDTETDMEDAGKPWSIQISHSPGQGWFIPAELAGFVNTPLTNFLHMSKGPVIFHNAEFDLDVMRQMGLPRIPLGRWTDSMVQAYHLGLPQSLKVLGYRLAGMEMQEYSDLVTAPSLGAFDEWLAKGLQGAIEATLDAESHMIRYIERAIEPSKQLPSEKGPSVESRLRRILADTARYDSLDVFERWEKIPEKSRTAIGIYLGSPPANPAADWEKQILKVRRRKPEKRWEGAANMAREVREELERRHGKMPYKSIVHVERKRAVDYACRDADAALRVWDKLGEQAAELKQVVPEEDRDDFNRDQTS